jgi:hypothetical protein
MKIKFSPAEWCELTGIEVIDPDGWDRKGDFDADWAKPIDFQTFIAKCDNSTTNCFYNRNQVYLAVLDKLAELL